MVFDIEKCLKEPLTKNFNCDRLYENLKGIYEAGQEENRHIRDEQMIKLNRLERKERPMKLLQERDGSYYCPICRRDYASVFNVTKYCGGCGQRIQL